MRELPNVLRTPGGNQFVAFFQRPVGRDRRESSITIVRVLNGQNSIEENRRAEDAALKLGLTAVGGSDAHFATAKWFMTVATEFESDVTTVEQMCAEIRAGRARPYVFPDPVD